MTKETEVIYQDGLTAVLATDAHGILEELLQEGDAIVTDPPYGISYKHRGASAPPTGKNRNAQRNEQTLTHGDDQPFDAAFLTDLGVPLVLFGANHYPTTLPGSTPGSWHVWDKLDGRPAFDNFSDAELIWVSGRRRKTQIFRHLWKGLLQPGSKEGKAPEPRLHQHQKPVPVMSWAIKLLQATPTRVIDPFAGSGSTLVAARALGIPNVGIEINRQHANTAANRCRQQELWSS